jgi:predicted secreted protein with PEFG-CTERM motif
MTDNSGTADMDETVSFNVQVVPEFATLAVMVMAISIAAVLVMSRLKPVRVRFHV